MDTLQEKKLEIDLAYFPTSHAYACVYESCNSFTPTVKP